MLGPRARESDAGTRGQRRNGMAETCNRANLSLSSITSEPSCLSEGRGELSTPCLSPVGASCLQGSAPSARTARVQPGRGATPCLPVGSAGPNRPRRNPSPHGQSRAAWGRRPSPSLRRSPSSWWMDRLSVCPATLAPVSSGVSPAGRYLPAALGPVF